MRRPQMGPFIAGAVLAGIIILLLLLLTHHSHHGGSTTTTTTSTTTSTTAGAPPPGAPAKSAPSGREEVGLNVNWLFNAGLYTPTEIKTQLGAVRATGVTLARTDALWEASEPQPPSNGVHHWNWSFDDGIALALASRGLRWLPILDYTAPWAESVPGQDHSAPRRDADFAAYARAFAARYGTGGTLWRSLPALAALAPDTFEVWNEPDNPEFWKPAPDAAAYADLYLAARNAIDAVDPSARVLIGGLSNPVGFLPALVHARPDLVGHVDGVAIHPYGANPLVVAGRVRAARTMADSLGLRGVPLYITEVGWTTSPPGSLDYAPAAQRPGFVADTVNALGRADCGIAATIVYTWVTPERNPADHEEWFGLATPSGGTTASTTAFAGAVRGVDAHTGATVALCG